MQKLALGIIGVFAFFIFATIGGSFYTVDEGEKTVVLRNGALSKISSSGFHWKLPFVDEGHSVSLRDGLLVFENVEAYTKDGQEVIADKISVTFRAKPGDEDVALIYSRYGTVEAAAAQLVTRRLGENLEIVFGQYTADRAIKERAGLGLEFASLMKDISGPVEILSATVENFTLDKSYTDNIREQMTQEVEVRKLEEKRKQADVQREITIIEADAAAHKVKSEANAQAESIRVKGEAEAASIKAKSDALATSPALVDLTKAERWDGKLPTHFVPGSTVPFLSIK